MTTPRLFLVPARAPRTTPDAEARNHALDPARSFLVEAPAGSGKTELLVRRYLKLLATVQDPSAVLALTFTRKATAEMQERVLDRLNAARHQAAPLPGEESWWPLATAVLERDAALGWNLLADSRRLRIRTLDSLCAELARAMPLLAGGVSLQPVEDSEPLLREAAMRTFGNLGGGDARLSGSLRTVLLHRDGNLEDCLRLLTQMLALRDQWGGLLPRRDAGPGNGSSPDDSAFDIHLLPRMESYFRLVICRALTSLSRAVPAGLLDEMTSLVQALAHAAPHREGEVSPFAVCRDLTASPGVAAEDLRHWEALACLVLTRGKEPRKPGGIQSQYLQVQLEDRLKKRLQALLPQITDDVCAALCTLTTLPPAHFPQEQWKVAKALFHVLEHALVELQLVFAETGQCDFTQIGLAARAALAQDESGDALASSGMRIEHLLVDEVQDTSSSQYELLEQLTAGWDGGSQTVFLVGDPKQSIYLFRQARVERFMQTLTSQALGSVPVEPLHLTANFRSRAALVESFNETFTQVFPQAIDPSHPEQVVYREANAAIAQPGYGAGMVWHIAALPPASSTAGKNAAIAEQTRVHAAEIRRIAADWFARPLPPERNGRPWSIAVLVRNRRHLREVVEALREGDSLPYRAVEIEPLGERIEILDLLALVRALLHPADRTAWLAVLRAPWCGLSMADLHRAAGGDDRAWSTHNMLDTLSACGDTISDDGIARLTRFWRVMERARASHGTHCLSAWIERTWRELGGRACLDDEQIANCESFFALLDELEEPGATLSLTRLESRLGKLHAAPAVHPHAIDLVTMHGAKGLEWDVVLLPMLEGRAPSDRTPLLAWLEADDEDEAGIPSVLAPIDSKGETGDPLVAWIAGVRKGRLAAELKRLLYVACTRAREELHLFATLVTPRNGKLMPVATSLLHAAWPAARAHIQWVERPALEPSAEPQPAILPLAATAEPPASVQPRTILRIPAAAIAIVTQPDTSPGEAPPERPQGSFAARAFGNAMHACLDRLARALGEGASASSLRKELPQWRARVHGLLRGTGATGAALDRQIEQLLSGLRQTLDDSDGLWLLSPHPGAASESALRIPQAGGAGIAGIRLDRTFLAGPEPGSTGQAYRWIVDFKTGSPGGQQVKAFLKAGSDTYAQQLERYAQLLAPTAPMQGNRIGLYYPMLPKLDWWVAGQRLGGGEAPQV